MESDAGPEVERVADEVASGTTTASPSKVAIVSMRVGEGTKHREGESEEARTVLPDVDGRINTIRRGSG